jgi:branched-subunit amino acid transport protein
VETVSATWLTLSVLFLVTVAFKAAGPLAIGGRSMPDRVAQAIALVAPALLAALVMSEALVGERGGLEVDARLVGLGGAALGVVLRASPLVVIAVAAASTAVARLAL